MFNGYLALDGTEILNIARTAAYLKALVPGLDVKCSADGLADALDRGAYTTPEQDHAPWYRGNRISGARFYGLFPADIAGAENSTRSVQVTELAGHGAITTSPRHGSREVRVTASAFAADEEAMMEGLAWLRDVLAGDGCSDTAMGCTGREMKLFAAAPVDSVGAYSLARTFHDVEVTEGPLVITKRPSKLCTWWDIEFTLTAGVPWAFTSLAKVGALDMDASTNFQDPVDEDCSGQINPYDQFIADPFFTAISRPPRPPVILPPNILAISSWRRQELPIPTSTTKRWGRTVPVVNVITGAEAAQYLRLRFYRADNGLSGCDYDGEFFISYLPAGATLTLDGIRKIATVTLADGAVFPAGNLLFGSGGRPFLWPTLGCQFTYTMTADLMPGQAGVSVVLDTAVRE